MGDRILTSLTLQNKGHRISKATDSVLHFVASKFSHAYTCLELTKLTKLSRGTVFRILTLLQKQKFLHKSGERYYFCRVEDDSACHQAVICEKCGKYEEAPLYEHAHPNLKFFKISNQVHEIAATCRQCQYTSAK